MTTDYQPRPLLDLDYLERVIEVGGGMGQRLALDALAEIRRLRARIAELEQQLADARADRRIWTDIGDTEWDGADAGWVQGLAGGKGPGHE